VKIEKGLLFYSPFFNRLKRLDLPLIQPFLYKYFCRLYLSAQPAFLGAFSTAPFPYCGCLGVDKIPAIQYSLYKEYYGEVLPKEVQI
jgi:hypothetical protein